MTFNGIRAVVFDVLGTVVDEDGTRREAGDMFAAASLPPEQLSLFLDEWGREQRSRMDAIRTEGVAWTDSDTIRSASLGSLVLSADLVRPSSRMPPCTAYRRLTCGSPPDRRSSSPLIHEIWTRRQLMATRPH
jgi:hypothetical protein